MNRLAELLASPGVIEEHRISGRVGIMAFHGGSLERMTDIIADAVAERCDVSTYIVRQPDGFRWHLPSREFDPAQSWRLAEFLDHVDVAIALHGYGRHGLFTTLLPGGSNRELARHLAGHLNDHLPDYEMLIDLKDIPVELRGLHEDNPVNRARQGGVQLELPPRVRGIGPFWGEDESSPGFRPHTSALIDGLVAAIDTW